MMPLPYCPATVSRIRDAAPVMPLAQIAQLIGWDGPQVERVAKRHGIELIGAKNGAETESVVRPESIRTAPDRAPVSAAGKPLSLTSSMTLIEIAEALPPRQAQLFRVLVSAGINCPPLPTLSVCARLDMTRDALKAHCSIIRAKLIPTRYALEGIKGNNGGYRIVTQGGPA